MFDQDHIDLSGWVTGSGEVKLLHPRTPCDHELKIDPHQYDDVLRGAKTHEVRVADRHYQVGQVLRLRAYDRTVQRYTGPVLYVRITNLTSPGTFGLGGNVCVMSTRLMGEVQLQRAISTYLENSQNPLAA